MLPFSFNFWGKPKKLLNPPAFLITFNERVWPNGSHQELGTEEWQANMLKHLQITCNTLHPKTGIFLNLIMNQNRRRKRWQVSSNLGELWSAFLDAVLDPGHHGVKNLLLTPDIELITGNYIDQLIGRQQHEFFTFHDLWHQSSVSAGEHLCLILLGLKMATLHESLFLDNTS